MKRCILIFFCILTVSSLYFAAYAQDDSSHYIENDWNFVDRSMDISQGIPDNAEGVLERIRDSRTLRVAMEPYFPPQEFIDPNKIGQNRFEGSDIQLAHLIADHMGVTLEIVPMEFTEVLNAINEDICDLAISALAFTPSRANAVTFSKGYYFAEDNAGSGIIIREEDRDLYHAVEDFSDKTIIAQSGSLQESQMAENFHSYKEFIRSKSTQDVYTALETGTADGAMVDIDTAKAYIEKNPQSGLMLLEDLRFPLEEQYQGDRIAAKKGEIQLIYFVNGVIDEVVDSGLYMEWYREAETLANSLGL